MKLITLNDIEREETRYSHKVNFTFADLTTAGLSQIFNIFPKSGALIAKISVERVGLKLVTPFTGGTIASMVMDIGDSGTVGRFIANANTDLFTALASNTKPHVIGATPYTYSEKNVGSDAITAIQAKFTSTVGNVNAVTAGECDIYLSIVDWNDLAKQK